MRILSTLLLLSSLLTAQSVAGLWVGTAQRGHYAVPLQLLIKGNGSHVSARFLNGAGKSRPYAGTFSDGQLVLPLTDYANAITATLNDAVLTGTFGGHARPETLHLVRVPTISGNWQIAVHGPKGETEWKLQVQQSGVNVRAVVLRIDGDTGALYGSFQGRAFELSRFTADGPQLLTLRLLPDGGLQVGRNVAHRLPLDAAPLPAVDSSEQHTYMRDPGAPLRFSFPDLNGHIVSSTDARFRGKVLLVTVGGSWCPNCHDEAPLLESLYRNYQAHGLEVVDLSFEEAAQLAHPTRLRAFIREYSITYPVLLAGIPGQLDQKLPQVADLNCWPTLFFIGRDGLVRSIHAGFAGPATGAAHSQLVRETDALVRRLLAARAVPDQPRPH